MRASKQFRGYPQTLIAIAVLATFGPARAQDIGELTAPGNSISAGISGATGDEKDRARFGMFNGLRKGDVNGLLGFSYLDRDSDSGKWFTLEGRNLGLDNRELSFSYRKLGDLKFSGEYSELVRHDPRTINTALQGPGTPNPTVVLLAAPGTGSDLNLELKRKSISLNAEKWFGGNVQLEVNFKNEDKTGARFWGRGFSCTTPFSASPPAAARTVNPAAGGSGALSAGVCIPPVSPLTAVLTGGAASGGNSQWALLLLPEPVNSTIRQIDTKFNYSGANLKLSGGYYGSFYVNNEGNLTPTIPGTLNNPLGTPTALNADLRNILGQPMALWPDNQSHQLFLGGNYSVTPKTKVNFKYSWAHATQNEGFLNMGLANAPAGVSSLNGKVDTTRAQVGFSSHPLDALHLHGDAKYEKKDNNTPLALYNSEGTATFTNGTPSPQKYDVKLEGSYRLPKDYSVTAGIFYDNDDHGTWTPTDAAGGVSGIRQKLEEKGYRLELRKAMSETFTGWLSYSSARRSGISSWLAPNALPLTGVTPVTDAQIYNRTAIFPFIFENRTREKWKAMGNWSPTDRLALTFFVEDGRDYYTGPTEHGLRDTGMRMYSADASFALNDDWKLSGYLSRGEQTLNAGHSTGYDAALKDTADSLGLALTGRLSQRAQMGADLTYLNDTLKYAQTQDPSASAANARFLAEQGGLPDVTYRLLRLKLFGQYAVDKTSYVRLDLIHQRTLFNEWTYNFNGVPFTYSDNTTLTATQDQRVTFLGVSYVMRFK